MKLKKAKIVIQSIDEIKLSWKEALNGNLRNIQKKNVILVPNIDTVSKIFSKTRMQILNVIIKDSPQSINEVAKLVKRDFKNVHSDINFLADVGLIDLEKGHGENGKVCPIPKYSGIEVDLAA